MNIRIKRVGLAIAATFLSVTFLFLGSTESVFASSPSIDGRLTLGTDPHRCGETNTITADLGTHVYVCYTLKNSGDVTLYRHNLEDNLFGVYFDNYFYRLRPGSSAFFLSEPINIQEPISITANWSSAENLHTPFVNSTAMAAIMVADSQPATVSVAHFAPFANSIDGTSVTVRINGGDALTEFKFSDIAKNVELAPGEYTIEILPTGTDTVAISGSATLEAGVDYTLAAIGDSANQNLELFALVDDNTPLDGKAKIRIGHLAPFANTLEGTQVNLCTDEGSVILENVPYKATASLELNPGDYDLKVVPVASGCGDAVLDLPSVSVAAGDVADLFVIGNISNLPLSFATTTGLTLIPEPQEPATVSVAHFAPFANSIDGTSVTVRINGGDALTEFKFSDIAKNVELAPGEYTIEILPTGTDTVAISGSATLEAGVDYTLAAIGDSANQNLELFALVDDNTPLDGKAKIRVGHLAPFANTLEGTQVNLCTNEGSLVLENVPYKATATLELNPGDYDLKVVPVASGCGDAVLDLPSVSVAAGDVADLFVIGNTSNLPLSFATTTGLTLTPEPQEPGKITIAHFAPFASPRSATSVTIRVNGNDAIEDLVFGNVRRNIEFAPGEYTIEVVPTGTDSVAIRGELIVESGVRYLVAAIGDGRFLPLELFVLSYKDGEWVHSASADNAIVRIAHFAPLASKVEDTRIDVCTDDGSVISSDIPYRSFVTLSVPAGEQNLMVASTGSDCTDVVLELPTLSLTEGDAYEVFTVGNNQDEPLASIIETDAGSVGNLLTDELYLPLVTQ